MPLTLEDLRRHHPLTAVSLLALLAMAGWFWSLGKGSATYATLLAGLGCLAIILPPRERMDRLPWRLRALPRRYDCAPILATVITSPGYGLNWFYGVNPFDETVHFVNGLLLGWVFGALVQLDGVRRTRGLLLGLGLVCGLAVANAWELFEWAVGIIGDRRDTLSDIALTATGTALGTLWHAPREG